MPAKREQAIWKGVWEIAKPLERRYGLMPMLSAAVLAFADISPEQRELLVEKAFEMNEKEKVSQKDPQVVDDAVTDARARRRMGSRPTSKSA